MSRVFWPSTGMRASTSPGIRSWPSRIWISEPTGKPIVTEWSVPGIFTSLPASVEQLDLRAHHLGRAAALRVDDHQRRQAGDLVELLGDRHAFFDVLELRLAGELGDDRAGQRVPVGQHRAGLELLVGLDRQQRAVRHLVALALAAVLVGDDDLAGTRDHHQLALAVGHVAHRRVEADDAVATSRRRSRPPPHATPHHRCGRCASSAACPARRSTARRSRRSPRRC